MSATINSEGKGCMSIAVAGTTGTAIGGVANPEGVDILILRATWKITTASTGAATVNIGVGAAVNTDATDIINALAANGAVTGWYNGFVMQNGAKTAVAAPAVWSSDKFVTFTGSASTAGLVATLYLEYIRA